MLNTQPFYSKKNNLEKEKNFNRKTSENSSIKKK